MKKKLVCVLLLGLCITGYNHITKAVPIVKQVKISQKQSMASQSQLRIINATSNVKRGDTGVITIQGAPNTLYNIKTSYKLANKTVSVIQWRTTDGTGVTTFNWVVSMETMSGTYDATISGGGNILYTNHKVLP